MDVHVRSPKTYRAGAAVQQYRAVKQGADVDHVVPATLNSLNRGIAIDNQDVIGQPVAVAEDISDTPAWESGAAFAAGAKLASDATGRAVAAPATQPVLAFAQRAATGAGQLIPVRLVPPGTVLG